jgi:hypothetical protein
MSDLSKVIVIYYKKLAILMNRVAFYLSDLIQLKSQVNTTVKY